MPRKSTRQSLTSSSSSATTNQPSTSNNTNSNTNTNNDTTSASTTRSNSRKRKSVAFEEPEPQGQEEDQLNQHQEDLAASSSTGRVTRSRRTSTASTSTPNSTPNTSTSSANQPPLSSKALGKRRAVSPDHQPTPSTSSSTSKPDSTGPVTKKPKLSHSHPSSTSKDYNLRSRSASSSSVQKPSTETPNNNNKMPRNSKARSSTGGRPSLGGGNGGGGGGGGSKSKNKMIQSAREEEEEFEDDLEQGYRDAEMELELEMERDEEEASSSKRGGGKGNLKREIGKRDEGEKEKEKEKEGKELMEPLEEGGMSSEPEREEGDSDPIHRDSQEEEDADNDNSDHDDEDDEDDEDEDDEEIEEYETSLGLNGEERDVDYPSGEDEDLPLPPRTFNESGDQLSSDQERQAAMDEADALFGALAGAAARSSGGGGLSGPGGSGGGGDDGGFGGAFQALRGMMSGMSNRLKGLLTSLKTKEGTATKKLMALQELAELLSISTEDTLAGYFQTEAFSKELVAIVRGDSNGMGSTSSGDGDDEGMGGGGEGAMTAEEAIAFGLDPAEVCGTGGGGIGGGGDTEENDVQMMLLACRCLANLMEALPGSAHSVVYAGAVPVLCSKLQDIQYIELAEQTLSTLEKISEEVPSSIVREGGLSALLTYLDFFSFHVQRTAVTAAANCCRSLSIDSFNMVKDAIPIFKNILGYPDQRVVEQACLAIVRIVDSYRHHPDKLEQLLTSDLLSAIKALLNPDSTTVGPSTYTQCLKALTTATKASPMVAINLVELEIAHTLYHLLTGVAPPEWSNEEAEGKQVLDRQTTTEDDMLVMQNLVQRPKEQVQETLNLVVELLPALPKEGIFETRAFIPGKSSKHGKTIKKEEVSPVVKREELDSTPDLNGRSGGGGGASESNASPDLAADIKMEAPSDDNNSLAVTPTLSRTSSSHRSSRSSKPRNSTKEALAQKRLDLVSTEASAKRQLVVKRYFALLLPTLVDVYSASVTPQVRSKAVLGLLKIVQFCEETALADILHNVPFAAFIAAILSSHDQTQSITNALQLIELLLVKMPDAYQYTFRREGVMHEVEKIASLDLITNSSSSSSLKKSDSIQQPSSSSSSSSTVLTPSERQAKDAITLRARHLRDKYGQADSEPATRAKGVLELIKSLVDSLDQFVQSKDKPSQIEVEAQKVVDEIAGLFANEKNPLSSFELLETGLVEGLLKFATDQQGSLASARRQAILAKSFMPQLESGSPSPSFAILVKRLQESLSRMEEFEVVIAAQNLNDADSRRNGTTMLGRQLKLRLIAEEGQEIPRSCTNIVVSIHAIATFQAFNDYLRPRIVSALAAAERLGGGGASGRAGSPGAGTLSSLLAAFASAAARADDAEDDPDLDDEDEEESGDSVEEAELEVAERKAEEKSTDTPPTEVNSNPVASSSKPKEKAPSPTRRRSSRLSGKGVEPPAEEEEEESKVEEKKKDQEVEDEPMDDDFDENEEPEEEPDREVFAGRVEPEVPSASRDERPVNLEVDKDAGGSSKIVAKTPDGTRVATPVFGSTAASTSTSNPAPARPSSSSALSKPRGSYAAAVKAEPTDFHLQFSIGGRDVGLDTTIFGAVHRYESELPPASRRNLWNNIYDIKFREVEGKARSEEDDGNAIEARRRRKGSIISNLPASIPADSQQAKILQLLHVLRNISADYGETSQGGNNSGLADTAFVNSKLTAKLNRQLEEPMIVASACLPDWAVDLAQSFPFLFPFDTRYTFLQSTSFGYARLMQKWIGQTRSDTSRRDENLGFLGRLQRQKVRISRDRILESAFKVFELYGSSRASLEVEFFNEVGSGLGPTLEFYAIVSREFARKSLDLWRSGDHTDESEYVHTTTGLFPSPVNDFESEKGKKALKVFRVLGQFVAKSMMDSRIIDVNFSRTFMRLVLDHELPLSVASVKLVDPALGKSLAHLQEYIAAKETIESGEPQNEEEHETAIKAIEVRGATVSDLTLDFTLPGTEIELKEGGKDISVEIENVEEYVELVIDWTLRRGVTEQILAFKQGFSTVFPVQDLQTFTPAEMVLLSGAIDGEDWSVNALVNAAKADHGFTMDSRVVQDLFSVMSEFDPDERRAWLSFTTGAQRLPIGGFASLKPPLTIVRKDGGDRALPSCMTCTNYVKLPDYSNRQILQDKLKFAVREGAAGFHLS
ncbi:putative ubiquitin-protein ligase UFD4 [Sporobolomyces salmoneus]|uniref:putative ubiquitin-protein ligase UFD4 n=1 Tax=Sporobolomyces salmoneus TaxID=183962 RepID=UPI0031726EF3